VRAAAGRLGEHAVAAGRSEGVDLELGLLVGGGDASIAEQLSHAADRRTTLGQRWLCEVDFGHGFWTPRAAVTAGEWWLSQNPRFGRLTGDPDGIPVVDQGEFFRVSRT
jgi:hypothetical protein